MKKILISYDFTKLQSFNFVAQNSAGAVATPATGQIWYDTVAGAMYWRNGSTNINPLDRANHTGTQLAATISNFDTQVRTSRLDQMAAPTAAVSLNAQQINNLANGTSAQDAVTLSQLQGVQNGTNWKNAVRVATTANVALSGLLTIDGITLVAGDRVLVKNQTAGQDNGIYVAASGAWTRATDADTSAKVTADMAMFIAEGTTQADTQWRLTTDNPIVLGTTVLVFGQFGAGTSYSAGNGINIATNVISVDTAVVVRKFAQTIGTGAATSITVTHSLGTQDITWSIRDATTNLAVDCDVTATSTTQAVFDFAVAPATNSLRVVIHG